MNRVRLVNGPDQMHDYFTKFHISKPRRFTPKYFLTLLTTDKKTDATLPPITAANLQCLAQIGKFKRFDDFRSVSGKSE